MKKKGEDALNRFDRVENEEFWQLILSFGVAFIVACIPAYYEWHVSAHFAVTFFFCSSFQLEPRIRLQSIIFSCFRQRRRRNQAKPAFEEMKLAKEAAAIREKMIADAVKTEEEKAEKEDIARRERLRQWAEEKKKEDDSSKHVEKKALIQAEDPEEKIEQKAKLGAMFNCKYFSASSMTLQCCC